MSAHVVSLQLHERKGEAPRAVAEVAGRVGGGLVGDSHEGRATRAVLIVDRSTLDECGLRPGDLREQVTLAGLPGVTPLTPGTELRIGGLVLRVSGPCEPCTHIGGLLGVSDPEKLRRSLVGRRGAVGTVIAAAGTARVGDSVDVVLGVSG